MFSELWGFRNRSEGTGDLIVRHSAMCRKCKGRRRRHGKAARGPWLWPSPFMRQCAVQVPTAPGEPRGALVHGAALQPAGVGSGCPGHRRSFPQVWPQGEGAGSQAGCPTSGSRTSVPSTGEAGTWRPKSTLGLSRWSGLSAISRCLLTGPRLSTLDGFNMRFLTFKI